MDFVLDLLLRGWSV